ncbi:hypothetical protein [Acidiferrobacter sp.]|uniref:hypothetical protein n=1 Tax=Acidiferrobacter sp. TaxID=1872107 RepID=UPI00260B26E2|nr:hypothetical protein [Acidiferrobacter sp.]
MNRLYRRLALLAVLALAAPAAFAEDALILTVGAMHLAHTHQSVAGNESGLNTFGSNVFGIAWEKRHYNGIAYGGELLLSTNTVANAGGNGQVASRALLVTLKKYHRPWAHVYPYIGAGVGLMDTQVSGVAGGAGVGPAVEVDGGVELEWAHSLGFYTELRGLYAPSGVIYGTRVNMSGVGLYAGISLLF